MKRRPARPPMRRGRLQEVPLPGGAYEASSLLDLLDNVLTRGILVSGDVVIGLADVDLIYLRLSVLLCAADRVLGPSPKRRARRA
jgi:hypothetical protein